MKIAYLTNQYPAVSHTFIREEISAVEGAGVEVDRYSIRRSRNPLSDPRDLAESERTLVLLDQGILSLACAALKVAMSTPRRFFSAALTAFRMGLRSERGVGRNLAYLVLACSLRHLLERRGCDHVHVHFSTNPTAVAMLCRMIGGPTYSFTAHGPTDFDRPWSTSLALKIKRASFVVAVCNYGRSQLFRHCSPDHWEKILLVRCGVSPAFVEGKVPPRGEGRLFVCVGRLCEQKGQLLLIDAATRLRDMGEVFELVLVGDGEMRLALEEAIAARNMQDRIKVTGWASSDEVREWIASARALVLPSFAEGLPVVIMEALAMQRPVVTTYIAGIPELVENGRCGWLVPAGSLEDLVTAMKAVLDATPEELGRMGEEGRRRVLSRHDPKIAVKPLIEAFRHTSAAP